MHFFPSSPNRPTGPIRFSSSNVCLVSMVVVPFPCNSSSGAKEVPGKQSCLTPWHQYPEKMYIKKCTSLQLAVSPWAAPTVATTTTTAAAKKCYQPFFDASGNKIIGATIRSGREIRCLPHAGFFSFVYWSAI